MAGDENKSVGEEKPKKDLSATEKELIRAQAKVAEKAAGEMGQALAALGGAIFGEGMPAKDALGLKDEMVEGLYGQAYRLFNNGKYGEAKSLFRVLIALNAAEPKYTMGLAACLHMEKQYELAAPAYFMVSQQDPENPVPYYHASDCYIKLGEPAAAIYVLEKALDCCGVRKEFTMIKDRATITIKSLKDQIARDRKAAKKKAKKKSAPKAASKE